MISEASTERIAYPSEGCVNWGRPRLARFASQVSFVAQFCALNDLTLKSFKVFFGQYLRHKIEPWRWLRDDDLRPLARLIDEPLATVNTLRSDLYELPACFGAFKSIFYDSNCIREVVYCPVCLSEGYHAGFHQVPWLHLCPIHRVPLKRRGFFGGDESYLRVMTHLLRSACPAWPRIRSNDGFPPGGMGRNLRAFLRWLAIVKRKTDVMRQQDAVELGESAYYISDLGILLGRLESLEPIPKALVEVFTEPPRRQTQRTEPLLRQTVLSLQLLARKISLESLLRLYVMTAARTNQSKRFRSLALEGVNRLRRAHAVCRCEWRWDRYDYWERVHAGGANHGRWLCPYDYAMEELSGQWLRMWDVRLPIRMRWKEFDAYAWCLKELVEKGLAVYPEGTPVVGTYESLEYPGLPELSLGSEIDVAVDAILEKMVAAHIEDLCNWLLSLPLNEDPWRNDYPGNINVFLNRESAWISSWGLTCPDSSDHELLEKDGFVVIA